MLCNSPKVKINLRLGAFGTSLHPTESLTEPFYFKCDIVNLSKRNNKGLCCGISNVDTLPPHGPSLWEVLRQKVVLKG